MKHAQTILIVVGCGLAVSGCMATKATPKEVTEQYAQLKSGLDEDALGASIEKLEAFRREHAAYDIATSVAKDIAALRAGEEGRFHKARELAREGEFTRAEKIMRDLVRCYGDTDEGRMAREFMQFEFFMFKANRLMMDRTLDEAETTLKELVTRKLTPEQTQQAERLLDAISNVRSSMAMANAAQMKNACRMLQVLLHRHQVENDSYPEELSLDDLGFAPRSAQDRIKKSLSAIEDYEVTDEGFRFVAVGKSGRSRLRITESEIKEESAQ